MRQGLQFLLLITALVALSGCGTKGPLFLPPPTSEPAAETEAAD